MNPRQNHTRPENTDSPKPPHLDSFKIRFAWVLKWKPPHLLVASQKRRSWKWKPQIALVYDQLHVVTSQCDESPRNCLLPHFLFVPIRIYEIPFPKSQEKYRSRCEYGTLPRVTVFDREWRLRVFYALRVWVF